MSEPHRIRLRGGWKLTVASGERLWTLPCHGEVMAEIGPEIVLTRRFNHPPVHSDQQICRLVLRHVAGVTGVGLDDAHFTPMMPVTDHPEAGFDFELPNEADAPHVLRLTVATADAAAVERWGEVYLEIDEGRNSQ